MGGGGARDSVTTTRLFVAWAGNAPRVGARSPCSIGPQPKLGARNMISSRKMLICVLLIVMVVLPLQLFATDGAKSGIVMNPSSGASRGEVSDTSETSIHD